MPGISTLLRCVVLATGPALTITLADLGVDEMGPEECFWCADPLVKDGHKDHLFGIVEGGVWNGLPALIVPSHPVCNTGKKTRDGLATLLAKNERVKARYKTVEGLIGDHKAAPEVVDGFNMLLAGFRDRIIDEYQVFLAEVDKAAGRAAIPPAPTPPDPRPGS